MGVIMKMFSIVALGMSLLAVTTVFAAERSAAPRVGVVFSGCGMMDGTELSEAVLTMLYLERNNAKIVYIAPNVPQADVIDHAANKPGEGTRNALAESARISRGNIVDIASVKSADLDVLILVGGLGSVKNLSDFFAKGKDCAVNPDFSRLVTEMNAANKPIGSMCLASANLARILGKKNITITIGGESGFVSQIEAMGATHQACAAGEIAVDSKNGIVTTPAMMVGPSTADIAVGIERMIQKVLSMAKK
jgi:enhancing lycopene biosynthesis protein 2